MNDDEPKPHALVLDHRLELTNEEISAIIKENGGAIISSKQMQALAAIGYQLETFGAIRTVQGDALIARSSLRSLLLRLHELTEKASLPELIEASVAIARIHKQFNESLRVSRELIETQDFPGGKGPVNLPRQVIAFPTGPITAETIIINPEKPHSNSQ